MYNKNRNKRDGVLGWWEPSRARTHTHTQIHINTHKHTHFYMLLATDTRILQPDTGDGLDVLSRRREAPCFHPLCRERKQEESGGERETYAHT